MKVSEIRTCLASEGIRLNPRMGQCFLHDAQQLDRIVALAALESGARVLEIGPGLGPLTERLLSVVGEGEVLAVEKDPRLLKLLKARLGASPRLHTLGADALEWLREPRRDLTGTQVVSNLPYSVASPILVELAAALPPPDRIVVTLQKEVVDRVVACPGTRDYGLLSLLVQLRYDPGRSIKIPRACFFPEPAVDSACVRLELRRPALLRGESEVRTFERVVRRAFSQRRKMMARLLLQDWAPGRLEEALMQAGVSRQARAEQLELAQFITMAKILTDTSEEHFDVVNSNDEVITQASRREVHRRGLRHRAVHILVFNSEGRVFLQRRSSTKDCFPGLWDSSAAGHLGVGESYDAAAPRELMEELGCEPKGPLERLFRLEASEATGQEFVWVYRAEANGPFALCPEEIAEGAWFWPAEVSQWVAERPAEFAPSLPVIWSEWLARRPLGTPRCAD